MQKPLLWRPALSTTRCVWILCLCTMPKALSILSFISWTQLGGFNVFTLVPSRNPEVVFEAFTITWSSCAGYLRSLWTDRDGGLEGDFEDKVQRLGIDKDAIRRSSLASRCDRSVQPRVPLCGWYAHRREPVPR